jgi:uncharacterized protein YhjY with autotransporter beta-barrel domain
MLWLQTPQPAARHRHATRDSHQFQAAHPGLPHAGDAAISRRALERLTPLVLLALCCSWATQVHAQAAPSLTTALTTLSDDGVFQYNGLEYAAAAANDRAYQNLLSICSPQAPSASCATGTNTQRIFERLRELEDNADQFLGRGETQYSLRLDPEGLGDALRWTAPEEFAAQGSLATRFANSQSSVLNDRFAALRIASIGLLTRADSDDGDVRVAASDYSAFGGSAGENSGGFSLGRLSVFVNGGFGTGDKAPTTFEDAFSFDGTEASAGADYRLSRNFVVGVLVGHTERRVDFNSALSIVDGQMRGNGQGGTVYGQFETDTVYVNASLGFQHLSLHTARSITYPSNNPDIPSVNETSTSDTGSNTLTATVSTGYVFHYRGFSAEPYLNGEYVHVRVNAFTEHSGEGFDFNVDEQSIHSSTGAVGLKLQYAILPPFGVIVPYVYAEYRKIFSDPSRTVESTYAAGDSGAPDMLIPTDAAPSHYYVFGGGGSVVLKHGLQGFMQYVRVEHYTNSTDHVVSGGVRWEF